MPICTTRPPGRTVSIAAAVVVPKPAKSTTRSSPTSANSRMSLATLATPMSVPMGQTSSRISAA